MTKQSIKVQSVCIVGAKIHILIYFRRIIVIWDFLGQFSNTLFWQLFPSPSDKWQMISVVFWWFLTLFGIPKKWWLIDIYSDIQFARAVLQKPKCIWYHLPTLVPCCIGPCIVCVLERERAHVLDVPSPRQNRRKVEARAIQIGRRTWDYLVIN